MLWRQRRRWQVLEVHSDEDGPVLLEVAVRRQLVLRHPRRAWVVEAVLEAEAVAEARRWPLLARTECYRRGPPMAQATVGWVAVLES